MCVRLYIVVWEHPCFYFHPADETAVNCRCYLICFLLTCPVAHVPNHLFHVASTCTVKFIDSCRQTCKGLSFRAFPHTVSPLLWHIAYRPLLESYESAAYCPRGHTVRVRGLWWAPNDSYLLTWATDGGIMRWSAASLAQDLTFVLKVRSMRNKRLRSFLSQVTHLVHVVIAYSASVIAVLVQPFAKHDNVTVSVRQSVSERAIW
jgi:WD40 repeat protein